MSLQSDTFVKNVRNVRSATQ